jgi:hypothetical protein
VAVLALAAAAEPASPAGLTLDWSVPDRLRGPESISESPSPEPSFTVRLEVTPPCPRDATWELDGERVSPQARSECVFELPIMSGGHDLLLEAGGQRQEEHLDVRDHLIVSIGDSVASGEGNPDGPGPRWLERRCHRSLRSGAALAAIAAERGDRHSSVTFVPLGCSGATIDEGLLHDYDGVEPDARKGPLPPQVDRALLQAARRQVGAVLVNVGANDVNFGPLVAFCMVVSRCEERRFDPAAPRREARDPKAPTARAVVRAALARLRTGYDKLAAGLRPLIDPDRVVIVEYFDPLRDGHGDTCHAALPGVSVDEATWAQREILTPLNDEVRAAAARNGWRVVSGVSEAFRTHGICARREHWVRRPLESIAHQLRLTGTLHPNEDGHRATATLIGPVLAAALGISGGTGGEGDEEDSGQVRWWWLPVAILGGAAMAFSAGRVRRRTGR